MSSNIGPSGIEGHQSSLSGFEMESRVLRGIRQNEFSDPDLRRSILQYLDSMVVAYEWSYVYDLAQSILNGCRIAISPDLDFINGVSIASAIGCWQMGDSSSAVEVLEEIVVCRDTEHLQLLRAASLLSQIYWETETSTKGSMTLESVTSRIKSSSGLKVQAALRTIRYLSKNNEYIEALRIAEDLDRELRYLKDEVNTTNRRLLAAELVQIHLNLGETQEAAAVLEQLPDRPESELEPRVHNFIAYVAAWTHAIQNGVSLGQSIRVSDFHFETNVAFNDAQHRLARAWALVQEEDLAGAHHIFLKVSADTVHEELGSFPVEKKLAALEGLSYTSLELGDENLCAQVLARISKMQLRDPLRASISGLVHGIDYCDYGKLPVYEKLSLIRGLRRRCQFNQGMKSELILRCILAESGILQELGEVEDETLLRRYFADLVADCGPSWKRARYENLIRLSKIATDDVETSNALEMVTELASDIITAFGNEDELSIIARYTMLSLNEGTLPDQERLASFISLQKDAEATFGINSAIGLKARYGAAKTIQSMGGIDEALVKYQEIEQNPGFATSDKEFRVLIISKVAELLFFKGLYGRAVKWYALVTKTSFRTEHELTQRDFKNHVMYGVALSKAGNFRKSRIYLERVFEQTVCFEPGNILTVLDGRLAFAAAAEGLGEHRQAAVDFMHAHEFAGQLLISDASKMLSIRMSVARNYELSDDRENAFDFYTLALEAANCMDEVSPLLLQDLEWRRACCRW